MLLQSASVGCAVVQMAGKSAAGHDLSTLTASLDKATTTQTADVTAATDILSDLLNTTVTAQNLQSTGLGKLVNRLRKSASNEVKDLAKKVLSHFKDTVLPTTPSAKAKLAAAAATATASPTAATAAAATATSADTPQRKASSTATAPTAAGAAATAATDEDSKSAGSITLKLPAPKNYTQSYINKSKLFPAAASPTTAASTTTATAAAAAASSPIARSNSTATSAAFVSPSPAVKDAAMSTVASNSAPASPIGSGAAAASVSSSASAGAGASGAPVGLQRFATTAVVVSGHGEFKIGLPDAKRTKIQNLLLSAVGTAPTTDAMSVPAIEIAVRLENALHQRYTNQPNEYNAQCRSITFNLRDPQNPELNSRLFSGDLQPEELVDMTPAEMASNALKEQREADRKWMRDATRSDWNKNRAMTDMWRCGKCKERKCSYYQMQTRSADEPMTTFVRCLNCGNRWRC